MIVSNYFSDRFAKERREAVHDFVDLVMMNSERVLLRTLDGLSKQDYESQLKAISIPTLILAGDKDSLIPPESSKFMYKKIEKSGLKILGPDIGARATCGKSNLVLNLHFNPIYFEVAGYENIL